MKFRWNAALALLMCGAVVLGTAGCGESDPNRRGKVQLTFWAVVNENNQAVMTEVVNNFNESNDLYYVRLVPKTSGYSASLAGTLKGSNPPNIVQIDDRYFKNYVNEGYLTSLEEYFVDKVEDGEVVREASDLDLTQIWPTAVDRYRYNPETGYSGGDNPLYGLPAGIAPGVMYYNKTALRAANINVISVTEEDIPEYNTQNGTSYLARGFYIYDEAPAEGLTARDGKYYVFNDCIPMSWEELISISELFTKSYTPSSPTNYGFFNEWWFSFGWSVGGDCLEWDDELGQYVMALGEETPNYLVTGEAGVTIDGTAYAEGDILSYADKHFVEDVLAAGTGNVSYNEIKGYVDSKVLYELPSIRDAFTLFLQLSQSKGKAVTAEANGLALSPTPTIIGNKSKMNLLTSNEVAFVVENFTEAYSIGKGMSDLGKEWGVSPLYQYRIYDESTGELARANGTEIKGKLATHSNTICYAIPSNAKSKDGAFEFIEYLAGPEAQALFMKANFYMPNQMSLAESEEYMSCTDNYLPAEKTALIMLTQNSSVGDWSYLEDGEWVNVWSELLNSDVRDGLMTLDEFFENECIAETNEILKTYHAKKFNG